MNNGVQNNFRNIFSFSFFYCLDKFQFISRLVMFYQKYFNTFVWLLVFTISGIALLPVGVYGESGTIYEQLNQGGSVDFGQNTTGYSNQQINLENWTPSNSGSVCSIKLYMSDTLTPTDGVKLTIYSNGTSPSGTLGPNGSVVASSTILHTAVNDSSIAVATFNFENCFLVVPGNYYDVGLARTGSLTSGAAPRYSVAYQVGMGTATNNVLTRYTDAVSWEYLNTENRYTFTMGVYGYFNYQTASFFGSDSLSFGSSTCRDSLSFGDFFSSSTLSAFGCIMFQPASSSLSFINAKFQSFNSVFPFNIFFDILNLARTKAEDYSVSNSAITLPLGAPGYFLGSTSVSLTSSTLTNLIGQAGVDLYWDFSEAIIWILTGAFILFTVI